MATIKVDVVSAEEHIFSGEAELVSLPGTSGELGIMPGHLPLITLIRPGFVRVHVPGEQEPEQIFVAGGVLEVQPEQVRAKESLAAAEAARASATGSIEIARIEAEIAALAAELAVIRKLRSKL